MQSLWGGGFLFQKMATGRRAHGTWTGAIRSKVGDWGDWSGTQNCGEGFINGFQFRSEPSQGSGDDTAGNDLKAFCTGTGRTIGNTGMSWGEWGSELKCYRNQAICAIRTQIEDSQGRGDDTALNNVDMECCDIPNAGAVCLPEDKWEVVHSCDATNRLTSYSCQYSYRTGVRNINTASVGGGGSSTTSISSDFSTGAQYQALSTNFQSSLSRSSTTNHNWGTENSRTFESETTTTASFDILPGQRSVLAQVVGYCGDFVVRTTAFRLQDYDTDENLLNTNEISSPGIIA